MAFLCMVLLCFWLVIAVMCVYICMLLLLMSAPGKIPDNYAVMAIKYCIILHDGKANRCFRAGYEA